MTKPVIWTVDDDPVEVVVGDLLGVERVTRRPAMSVRGSVWLAAELGYEVTVVKDATADYSAEEMHAALDINIPNYASAVVTTAEVVNSICPLEAPYETQSKGQ